MNKLRFYRKLNKLKQSDIAKILFITQPNYSNIEKGKVKLNFEYAKILANLYNIPLSKIIDNDKNILINDEQFNVLKEFKDTINKMLL